MNEMSEQQKQMVSQALNEMMDNGTLEDIRPSLTDRVDRAFRDWEEAWWEDTEGHTSVYQ